MSVSLYQKHCELQQALLLPPSDPQRVSVLQRLAADGVLMAFSYLTPEQRVGNERVASVWNAYLVAKKFLEGTPHDRLLGEHRKDFTTFSTLGLKKTTEPSRLPRAEALRKKLDAKREEQFGGSPCYRLVQADESLVRYEQTRQGPLLKRALELYDALVTSRSGYLAALTSLQKISILVPRLLGPYFLSLIRYRDDENPFYASFQASPEGVEPKFLAQMLGVGAEVGDSEAARYKIRLIERDLLPTDPRTAFMLTYPFLAALANKADRAAQRFLFSQLSDPLRDQPSELANKRIYRDHQSYLLNLLEQDGAPVDCLEVALQERSNRAEHGRCVDLCRRLIDLGAPYQGRLADCLFRGLGIGMDVCKAVELCRDVRRVNGDLSEPLFCCYTAAIISKLFEDNERSFPEVRATLIPRFCSLAGVECDAFIFQARAVITDENELLELVKITVNSKFVTPLCFFVNIALEVDDLNVRKQLVAELEKAKTFFPEPEALALVIAELHKGKGIEGMELSESHRQAYRILNELDENKVFATKGLDPYALAVLWVKIPEFAADEERVIELFKNSLGKGNVTAALDLGIFYNTKKRLPEALPYLNQASEAYIPEASSCLLVTYFDLLRQGRPIDFSEFGRVFSLAKSRGEWGRYFVEACLYLPVDIEKAIASLQHLTEAAQFTNEQARLEIEGAVENMYESLYTFSGDEALADLPVVDEGAVAATGAAKESPKLGHAGKAIKADLEAGKRVVPLHTFESFLVSIEARGAVVKRGAGSRISVEWNGVTLKMHIPHGEAAQISGGRLADLSAFLRDLG